MASAVVHRPSVRFGSGEASLVSGPYGCGCSHAREIVASRDVVVPDSVRLFIGCMKIDCRCAVVEREGCRLHLAFVQAHRIRNDDIWANFDIDTIGCLVPNEASDIIADPRR
jgi:ABC-type iron transport system FetAB ATPase subunit